MEQHTTSAHIHSLGMKNLTALQTLTVAPASMTKRTSLLEFGYSDCMDVLLPGSQACPFLGRRAH
jgi:hypothetical protein